MIALPPPTTEPELPDFVGIQESRKYRTHREEIIKDILNFGRILMLSTHNNFGKSTIIAWLIAQLAKGEPFSFWGKPCKPNRPLRTLYLATEDYKGTIDRFRDFYDILEVETENVFVADCQSNKDYCDIAFAKHDYDVVVIDTLQMFFSLLGRSVADNDDVNYIVTRLYRQPAIIFSHHLGKVNNSYRGAGALGDGVDRHYTGHFTDVDEFGNADKAGGRVIKPEKVKDGKNDGIAWECKLEDRGFASLIPIFEEYNEQALDPFAKWKELATEYFLLSEGKRVSKIKLYEYCTGKKQTRVASVRFVSFMDSWIDFDNRCVKEVGQNEEVNSSED